MDIYADTHPVVSKNTCFLYTHAISIKMNQRAKFLNKYKNLNRYQEN